MYKLWKVSQKSHSQNVSLTFHRLVISQITLSSLTSLVFALFPLLSNYISLQKPIPRLACNQHSARLRPSSIPLPVNHRPYPATTPALLSSIIKMNEEIWYNRSACLKERLKVERPLKLAQNDRALPGVDKDLWTRNASVEAGTRRNAIYYKTKSLY